MGERAEGGTVTCDGEGGPLSIELVSEFAEIAGGGEEEITAMVTLRACLAPSTNFTTNFATTFENCDSPAAAAGSGGGGGESGGAVGGGVDVVAVVDCSGSMYGEKLDLLLQVLCCAVLVSCGL